MQRRTLKAILDDVSYSCGASFEDIEFPDGLESVCIRDHNCGDPVERLYYSAEYDAIILLLLCIRKCYQRSTTRCVSIVQKLH